MFPETLSIIGLVFVISIWMTGRLASSAARLRLLDHPNERSLHGAPIPRTGGPAVLANLLFWLLVKALLFFFFVGGVVGYSKASFLVAPCGLVLLAVFVFDPL